MSLGYYGYKPLPKSRKISRPTESSCSVVEFLTLINLVVYQYNYIPSVVDPNRRHRDMSVSTVISSPIQLIHTAPTIYEASHPKEDDLRALMQGTIELSRGTRRNSALDTK
jgi:hypothetical protein